jgi:hypothetical protein
MPPNEHERQAPKEAGHTRHLDNRRDFLRKFGTALGGVTLIGGGSNFLLGQTALPSGIATTVNYGMKVLDEHSERRFQCAAESLFFLTSSL